MSAEDLQPEEVRVALELRDVYGMSYLRSIQGGIAVKAAGDIDTIPSDQQEQSEARPAAWD